MSLTKLIIKRIFFTFKRVSTACGSMTAQRQRQGSAFSMSQVPADLMININITTYIQSDLNRSMTMSAQNGGDVFIACICNIANGNFSCLPCDSVLFMTTLNNSALNAINIVKLIASFECALKKTREGVFFSA